ncbi:MAG: hypothetical protein ACE5HY_01455, partial [Candidatus Hydrothermarchaeales archaeon]
KLGRELIQSMIRGLNALFVAAAQKIYQNDRFKSTPLRYKDIDYCHRFYRRARLSVGLYLS